jgi:hypothetical protein
MSTRGISCETGLGCVQGGDLTRRGEPRHKEARYFENHGDDQLDEAQLAAWMRQAGAQSERHPSAAEPRRLSTPGSVMNDGIGEISQIAQPW